MNHFGGAFELVHYHADDTYKKLDQMTYFFWNCNQCANGKIPLMGLPKILKYASNGTASIVRSFSGSSDECEFDHRIPNYRENTYRLSPVIGSPTASDWQEVESTNPNSPIQCHFVHGKMLDGRIISRCLATLGGNDLQIIKKDGDLQITNSETIANEISTYLVKAYAE